MKLERDSPAACTVRSIRRWMCEGRAALDDAELPVGFLADALAPLPESRAQALPFKR